MFVCRPELGSGLDCTTITCQSMEELGSKREGFLYMCFIVRIFVDGTFQLRSPVRDFLFCFSTEHFKELPPRPGDLFVPQESDAEIVPGVRKPPPLYERSNGTEKRATIKESS